MMHYFYAREVEDTLASQAARAEFFEETVRASLSWRSRWPRHCAACGGWGGDKHYARIGVAIESLSMLFEACEATDPRTCHRCGEPGLDEDSHGPCGKCGWDYDDGDPAAA